MYQNIFYIHVYNCYFYILIFYIHLDIYIFVQLADDAILFLKSKTEVSLALIKY